MAEHKASPASTDNEAQPNGPTFSIIHMTLLHHAGSHMTNFMGVRGQIEPMVSIAIDSASTAAYLLDQLLALSALHLSTINTSKSSLYHYQATELQTRALGLFNQVKEGISESNCIPTFLFASLLGIHVLKETLSNHLDNLAAFLDAFIRYVRLHCGVRAVTNAYWAIILESNLKPLLYVKDLGEQVEKQEPGTETSEVRSFLKSVKQDSPYVAAYQEALTYVQWVLDICKLDASSIEVGAHAVMAWPLVVSKEYFDALGEHKPEALVVFAFYAGILHRYRRFWVFGDSGSALVHMLLNELSSEWQDLLQWPVQVLSERHDC
jgi:hypothetical protein